jgi:hypothetical protein
MREAAGARAFPLAGGDGRWKRVDAARRTGNADQRNGSGASASNAQLVSSSARSIKHFHLLSCDEKIAVSDEKTLALIHVLA